MVTTQGSSLVRQRQAPLRAQYARAPQDATIRKRARTFDGHGTDPRLLHRLQAHAQRSCVNLDTLRRGVPVTTRTHLDAAG
jgi:hypothetical protein